MFPTRRLRFADISILYKILSGFSLCCFLAAALGAFAVWRLNDGKNLMLDFSNASLPSIQSLLMIMQSAVSGIHAAELSMLHADQLPTHLRYQQQIYAMRNRYLGSDMLYQILIRDA